MLYRAPNLLPCCKYYSLSLVITDLPTLSSDQHSFFSVYTPRSAFSRSRLVISFPPPLLATTNRILMGSNLSKFLFNRQLYRDTISLTPPPPILPSANEILIHQPEVEWDSENEFESYVHPMFLSSPYPEENIVTISDSE